MINRKFILKITTFLTTLICPVMLHSQNQDAVNISYEDNFNFSKTKFIVSDMAKFKRISNKGYGNIDVRYKDDNMPDSLKRAVEIATGVWKDYMNIKDSLKLDLYFDNTIEHDIITNVAYNLNVENGMYYPKSLYSKLGISGNTNNCDAEIKINSDIDWCIGIGTGNEINPKKLLLAMLQSIGRSLGYGSSVKKDKRGDFRFYFTNGISVFDKLVFSEDGKRMEDLTNKKRQEFKDFVLQKCGYLYALQKADSYKIYAPENFDEIKSLKYSANPSSIMYHGECIQSDLVVDEATINMLSSIGWNFNSEQPFKIVGEDIDETGITSAYQPHKFYIQSNGLPLSKHEWEYLLPLKTGGYKKISTSTNTTFTIPAVNDEEPYEHTIEGDICGIINFKGISDGKTIDCSYCITLELKPRILEVDIIDITPCSYDDSYYDATVDVYYQGSHYLHSYVEEEYSSLTKAYFSDSPYYARFKITDIDSLGEAYFNIVAKNDYGNDTYVQPLHGYYNQNASPVSVNEIERKSNITHIDVYSTTGQYLKRINKTSELKDMSKRLFILKIYNDNGKTITVKYLNK